MAEDVDAVKTAGSEAAWATIQLVNALGGITFASYERLLEYGEMVDLGVPPPAAAEVVLRMTEPRLPEGAVHGLFLCGPGA